MEFGGTEERGLEKRKRKTGGKRRRRLLSFPLRANGSNQYRFLRQHPLQYCQISQFYNLRFYFSEGSSQGKQMGNSNCIFLGCIDQASVGVVERWGRFHRLAQPGLQFFNIFAGECLAGVLSTRINSLDVTIETKTKVLTPILNFRFSVVSIERSWWVCVARVVNYIVRFQRILPEFLLL